MVAYQKTQRHGGDLVRTDIMKQYDIYRGKIAEFVVQYFFKQYHKESNIDLNIYGWGKWDDGDLMVDNKTYSIKSGKYFASWLMLEKDNRRWEKPPNYFVFVTINKDEDGGTIHGYTTPSIIFQDKYLQFKGNNLKGTNTKLDVDNYCMHKTTLSNDWFKKGLLDKLF